MSARTRTSWIGLLSAVTVLLAVCPPVDAQRSPRRDGPGREQLEQRIRAQMGRLMRERMGLSDEEATRLSAVVETYDARRRTMFRAEQTLRRESEALRERERPDAAEAAELLDRMVELRRQEAALFAEEQAALREILTPVQVLQLHALREAIGQRIRALRSGRGDGETGRRRGDPPPLGTLTPAAGSLYL